MNKFGMVLGVAAIATLAGCKDPDYVRSGATAQTEVKNAAAEPAAAATAKPAENVAPVVAPEPAAPVEPVAKPAPVAPPEPEYTIYIVQRGDCLSKIASRFKLRLSAIRQLNPQLKKGDVVYIGMKLKLPGKVDVGVQSAPAAAKPAAKAGARKVAAKKSVAYKGATKDYVVKNGDTLGAIALESGITVRQLKELNGLSKNSLRIGQKLKVPAEKVVSSKQSKAKKPAADKAAKPDAPAKSEVKVEPAAAVDATTDSDAVAPAAEATVAPAEGAADDKKADAADQVAPAADAAPETINYTVQEGDDITGIALRWGLTGASIRELNKLGEKDQLVPGQIIKLPAEAQQ